MPNVPDLYIPLFYAGAGLLGFTSCFFGFKLFRLVITALLSLSGAALLAWAGFHYGQDPVLWSVGGLVVGAILGGVLAMFFYSLAVATVAALFVATTLMPWVQLYEIWLQWAILGVICTVAALVALSITNFMIRLATSMLGSFLMVHAFLYFSTGQTIHQVIEEGADWTLYLDLDPLVAAIAVGVGLLGFLLQSRSASKA